MKSIVISSLLLLLMAGGVSAQDSIPASPVQQNTPGMSSSYCVNVHSSFTTALAQQVSELCSSAPHAQLLKVRLPQAPQEAPARMSIVGEREHVEALVEALRKLPLMLGEVQECEMSDSSE